MSWIRIEIQKRKAPKIVPKPVEHIDYEKIREITREVVSEGIGVQMANQRPSLTKEDIQEAICTANIQAGEGKNMMENERKTMERPSRFRAAAMAATNTIIPGLLAVFAVLACIGMWIEFKTALVHPLLEYIAYTVMFVGVIVVSVCCGIEAWKDDDENAIKHFNTNVALVALIVAFVALVKG